MESQGDEHGNEARSDISKMEFRKCNAPMQRERGPYRLVLRTAERIGRKSPAVRRRSRQDRGSRKRSTVASRFFAARRVIFRECDRVAVAPAPGRVKTVMPRQKRSTRLHNHQRFVLHAARAAETDGSLDRFLIGRAATVVLSFPPNRTDLLRPPGSIAYPTQALHWLCRLELCSLGSIFRFTSSMFRYGLLEAMKLEASPRNETLPYLRYSMALSAHKRTRLAYSARRFVSLWPTLISTRQYTYRSTIWCHRIDSWTIQSIQTPTTVLLWKFIPRVVPRQPSWSHFGNIAIGE